METSDETIKKIKDRIWKRRNTAIDDANWARSDVEKAKLEGIREGLEIAHYLI
jgi:hypothetical protein